MIANARSILWCAVAVPLVASCDAAGPAVVPPVSGFFAVAPTGVSATNRTVAGFNSRREFAGSDGVTAFRVIGGVEHSLQARTGSVRVLVSAINESGDVVGADYVQGDPYPRIDRWPANSDVPEVMPFQTLVADMNDAGDMLFSSGLYSRTDARDTAFVLWTKNGLATISSMEIPNYGGLLIFPFAINNSREIFADVFSGGLYWATVAHAAPRLPTSRCEFVTVSKFSFHPVALNDSGQSVISYYDQYCLRRPGKPSLVYTRRVVSRGLNNNGWLIFGPDPYVSAAGSAPIPADSLFASPPDRGGWAIEKFVAINDNNDILAVGFRDGLRQFIILAPKSR